MADDDSLLDVFVNVKPRFDQDFDQLMSDLMNRVRDRFINMAPVVVPVQAGRAGGGTGGGGGGGGTGGGTGGGGGGGGGGNNAFAADLRTRLRLAIDAFQREKAFLSINVRIANDEDLKKRLQALSSEVAGQAGIFRTSADDTTRINAILRINEIRREELRILRESTDATLRLAGLDSQRGATQDKNFLFQQQKSNSETSLFGVKSAGKSISASGDNDLIRQFTILNEQIDAAKRKLSKGLRAENLIDVTDATEQIRRLSDQIDALRSKANAVTDLKDSNQRTFKAFQDEESTRRVTSNVESSLRQQAVQGISSDKRAEILAAAGAIKIQEEALRKAASAFDGSTESLNAYLAEFVKLNGITDSVVAELARLGIALHDLDDAADFTTQADLRGKLKGIQVDATRTGSSFNNLSNNAYQAGQAIEDFAVGFSLNGIAGGIRGAANNVAFILNDMSRLPGVTNAAVAAVQKMRPALPLKEAQELGAKYASMIPLAAGIGSALAIVVLPKMVEWLQSLTEIEYKLQNIGEQIKRNVADAEFNIGLEIGSSKFERDLDDAKSIEDIVKRTNDLIQKRDENQQKISSTAKALEESGAFGRGTNDISTAFQVSVKDRDALEKKIAVIREQGQSGPGLLFGIAPTEKQLGDLKKSEEGVRLLAKAQQDLDRLQRSAKSGSPDLAQNVVSARESFVQITKELDRAKESTDGFFRGISDENVKALKSSLGELGTELDKINKLAIEASEIQNKNITQGLDAIIDKNKELAFGLRLARAELKDSVPEGATQVDELFRKNDKIREDIDNTILDALKSNDPGVRSKADAAAETQSKTLQLDLERLLSKSKDDLKKLEEKDKKSVFTNPEEFAKKLQTNVLSSNDESLKATKDLTKSIEFLTRQIEIEQKHLEQNKGKFFPLSDRGAEFKREQQLREKRAEFGIPLTDNMQNLIDVIDAFGKISGGGDKFSIESIIDRQVEAIRQSVGELLNPLMNISGSTKDTVDAVRKIDTTAKAAP